MIELAPPHASRFQKNWFRRGHRQFSIAMLILGFLAVTTSLIYGIVVNRVLYDDGSLYLLEVIKYRHPSHLVFGTYRYLTILLDLPTLAVLALTQNQESLTQVIRTWGICNTFYPFISLIFCWRILSSGGQRSLFLFPLASFAAGSMLVLPFPGSEQAQAMALVWPLTLLVVLGDLRKTSHFFGASGFTLALSISHESAAFSLLIIGCYLTFDVVRLKDGKRQRVLLAILCGAVAAWGLIRSHEYPTRYSFIYHLTHLDDFYVGMLLGSVFCFALSAVILRFFPRLNWAASALVIISIIFAFAAAAFEKSVMTETFGLRAYETLLSLALLIVFIILASPSGAVAPTDERQLTLRILAIAILFWVAAKRDMTLNRDWEIGIHNLTNILDSPKSCILIPKKLSLEGLQSHGIEAWVVPSISVLLQERRHPSSIAFVKMKRYWFERSNPCSRLARESMVSFGDFLWDAGGEEGIQIPKPSERKKAEP